MFLPVLWFEQHVTMKPEFTGEIGQALSIPTTVRICGIVMIVLGVIMVAWTPFDRLMFRRRRRATVNDASIEKVLLQQNLANTTILVREKEKEAAGSMTIIEAHPLIESKAVRLGSENGTTKT